MRFTILTLFLMLLGGCEGYAQTVRPSEPVTLKNNQSASIRGADLKITVTRIGRKWLANGGGETLDFIFTVNHGGNIETFTNPIGDGLNAGGYKIEVVKTEPFGEGYATFIVNKYEPVTDRSEKKDPNLEIARKFVEGFGWHLDETILAAKVPLEFPADFHGLPFYHYQAASNASGINMTPLLARKVAMLKYTLKEKLPARGAEITVYAHLIIENGAVSGAWRTDSSGSAPGIYSFAKPK